MKPACVFWLLCTAMLCAGVPAQQTWRVNCLGGPGVDFTDLPQAVAAAAPGDRIVVTSTSIVCGPMIGGGYTAPTIDKPLTIVGSWSPAFSNSNATLRGTLSISGIPAGQQVLLSGLFIGPELAIPPPSAHGISITNCDGDIVMEGCNYGNTLGLSGSQLIVHNCANVVFRGTQMSLGGASLRVINSNVLLTTVSMNYCPPSQLGGGYTTPTETLYVQNSTVTMVGSIVRGSSAGDWSWVKPGAIVHSGLLRVGPGSLLQGGTYYPVPPLMPQVTWACGLLSTPPVAAVQRDPQGVIHLDGPSAPVVPIPSTYHSWVTANASYGVTVAGEPGSFALLVASDMISPLPTPFGSLWLDPIAAWTVDLVALPTGSHQWTFQCPSTAPTGHAFALQSLLLDPEGQILLTEPSPVLVAWAAGTIP